LLDEYIEQPPEKPPFSMDSGVYTNAPIVDRAIRMPLTAARPSERKSDEPTQHQLMAPLDSYATASCVNKWTVKLTGATITPVKEGDHGHIRLAAKGHTVKRIGTARITIRAGSKKITHNFEVMDMPDPILIGLDLFPAIGIYIGGVPTKWPGDETDADAARAAAEAERDLHRRLPPWAPEHAHEEADLQKLREAIAEQLVVNAGLSPAAAACRSIPESILRLPMHDNLQGSKTYRKQYPLPKAAEQAIAKIVEEWIAAGYIEPARSSDFHTPLLAAAKKDLDGLATKYRICMDLKHINALISREGYSNGRVPRIEELLKRVQGFTHASCLDMSAAYHQLEVAEEDRHKLTFTHNNQRWQWKRWPFGLLTATSQFQKVMEVVLEGIPEVVVYVDDIAIVTSGSMEDHALVVKKVLQRLNDHGLRLNLDKCHFGYKSILLLGHKVAGDSRSIDPLKVKQAVEWPVPSSGKEIQRMLGFTNFLRDYIPDYAQLAHPLDGLRSAKKFAMDEDQLAAFRNLQQVVKEAPFLSNPDPSLPFQVATDASQSGLGAILYQQPEDSVDPSDRRYIAFASKSLAGAQKNYPATKRELLGVVFALRAFSHWLLGEHFVLYTDHEALTSLFTKSRPSYTVSNWFDVLLEYDFEVRHRPGTKMLLPDTLSRLYTPPTANDPSGLERRRPHGPALEALAVRGLSTIENPIAPDRELQKFIRERHNKKAIIGKRAQIQKLQAVHATGHFGSETLFKTVWRDGFYWKGMRQQCDEVTGACFSCLSYNVQRHGFHPTRSLRADDPWDHIAIDCAVGLPPSRRGNTSFLVVVDVASRFVIAKPLPDTKEHTVARALFELFTVFGPPKVMQSDRGTEFVNKVLKKLTAAAGIDHRLVAAYNPQANGLAERAVKSVKQSLKKRLMGDLDRWDEALPGSLWSINTKEHALTKAAPFTLFFSRGASAWQDYSAMELNFIRSRDEARAVAELTAENAARLANESRAFAERVRRPARQATNGRQDRANELLDSKRPAVDTRIRPGSIVMLQDQRAVKSKWDPLNYGLWLVERQHKRSKLFVLSNISNGRVLSRHVPAHQLSLVKDTSVPVTANDGKPLPKLVSSRAILKILDDRPAKDGTTEYKVRWKTNRPDSWLPSSSFQLRSKSSHHRRIAPLRQPTQRNEPADVPSRPKQPKIPRALSRLQG
jgi:transposase InsO family protein